MQPSKKDYSLILVEGKMGSGKTTTSVALIRDAVAKNPDTRVFANIKLHEIPYMYLTMEKLMEDMNTDTIKDGYLLLDEGYLASDCRIGSKAFNRVFTWFGMQSRKRKLTLILVAQHLSMIDMRLRLVATKTILCSKTRRPHYIKVTITTGMQKHKTKSYDGSQYWKYFDTYEVPDISDKELAKAIGGY